jgi:adenylylsulfate kinase-like enzyme
MPKSLKDKRRSRMTKDVRKEKNKHSAAKSRAMKKAYVLQLEATISNLQAENEMLKNQIQAQEQTLITSTTDDAFVSLFLNC